MESKRNNKIFLVAGCTLFLLIAMPCISFAADPATGIVPCGNADKPCTLCDLISGINKVVNWGTAIVLTVATVSITIAGIMYIVSTGNEAMMTQAKGFLAASLIGFFVVIGAWLIINITIDWVLPTDIKGATGKTNWFSFEGLDCGSNIGAPGSK